MIAFEAPIHVVPKARPRRGKGGVWYTPSRTRKCEAAIALVASSHFKAPLEGDLCVVATMSKGRGDTDNRLKTVLDAGNGIMWVDDKQCVDVRGIALASSEPFLRVEVSAVLGGGS